MEAFLAEISVAELCRKHQINESQFYQWNKEFLDDAGEKIEDFRWEYNHFRPHSALNESTPKEFVNLHQETSETLLLTV